MIPGVTTKLTEGVLASAATIYPKTDIVRLTGSTQVDNIIPAFGGGFGGVLFLIPADGAITISNTGNVQSAAAVSALQNKITMLVYIKALGKWITHALA